MDKGKRWQEGAFIDREGGNMRGEGGGNRVRKVAYHSGRTGETWAKHKNGHLLIFRGIFADMSTWCDSLEHQHSHSSVCLSF